ncbi:protein kinase domain-containing protein, partial [Trichonephila clavata]
SSQIPLPGAVRAPEYTDWCHSSPPEAIAEGVHKEGDKADMWQFGILSLDLLTNLKLSDGQSSQFVLWHHDVWPFIQKVLLHKEYLQFLMEDAFKNVLFNDLDFDLSHEFLQDILVLEPGLRISASDAMKHDFVTIQWPQVPSTFGMPKQIAEHPSKPRAKKKMKPATGEGEVERVGAPLEEAISKQAVDALKTKMDKIQKEKMKRRESLAAVAGKNPVKIKQNLSSMLKGGATDAAGETFSLSDTEVREDGVIKKRVEVNKKNNPGSSGRQSRIATIGPHKKLQPKVSKDSARSTSSQLRRQSRSSVEEVNKFINSRDRNLKRKSPIRRISENRTRSPSPGAKKSLGTKKPPNNPGKSAGNKDSPNNPGKSPGDKNTPDNMRKSPGNKNSPNNPGKSPSKNNPSGGPKKSESTSKPVKVGERRTSSHDCSEQNVLLVQSVL